MKSRRILLTITTVLLTSILSGCIIVPHGHRHRYYDDRSGGGYQGGYQGDRDGRDGRHGGRR